MNQDYRKLEQVDVFEECEMIPLETMIPVYSKMNETAGMDFNQSHDIGLNEWMETRDPNEDMYMSRFNPMDMMYGDANINELQGESDVDFIVSRIERYNPLAFKMLRGCEMEYGEEKAMVRRIVKLTLMYNEE